MKTFRLISILVLFASLLVVTSDTFADDGSWGDPVPLEMDWIGDGEVLSLAHEDFDPFKGNATLTVTNTGSEPWGDFHFGFYDYLGGQDISNLAFQDISLGGLADPTSSHTTNLTWDIDNVTVGATIDLFFYGNPVLPTQTVTFNVYTANPDQLSWFGLQAYPTPVPEPVTAVLLCAGSLALIRRKKA